MTTSKPTDRTGTDATRSSFDDGSRVVVHRRRFDDPITDDERLEALRTAREDYVDRNGSEAADLVGSALPVPESDDDDEQMVAFACAVTPDGVPVGYGGHAHTEDDVLGTAVEAAAFAERFAAVTNTDIEVQDPDGSTRTVEMGGLNGVPGFGDDGDGGPSADVERAARSAAPLDSLDERVGVNIDHVENMDHFGHFTHSHKKNPYGALHVKLDWYRGVNEGRAAHAFLSDHSMVSGWQKWDTWYENRYSHMTHDWSNAQTGNLELAAWRPKGTQVGTVTEKVSVGASVGSGGGSMSVGMEWSYSQPDVYEEDKSEPTDHKAKWHQTIKYSTDPRNSTVNYDPASLCVMDETTGSRTRICSTHYGGYWTPPSSLYDGSIDKGWNWYVVR